MENNRLIPASQRFFYRLGIFASSLFILAILVGALLLGRFGADTPVVYRDDVEHFSLAAGSSPGQ